MCSARCHYWLHEGIGGNHRGFRNSYLQRSAKLKLLKQLKQEDLYYCWSLHGGMDCGCIRVGST